MSMIIYMPSHQLSHGFNKKKKNYYYYNYCYYYNDLLYSTLDPSKELIVLYKCARWYPQLTQNGGGGVGGGGTIHINITSILYNLTHIPTNTSIPVIQKTWSTGKSLTTLTQKQFKLETDHNINNTICFTFILPSPELKLRHLGKLHWNKVFLFLLHHLLTYRKIINNFLYCPHL